MWKVVDAIWWLYILQLFIIFTVDKGDCQEITQDFISKVVFPRNVQVEKISNNAFHLTFQIEDGKRNLYFNLQTRKDLLDDDDFCQMEGIVYNQNVPLKVELAVCNGIIGTISGNSSKVEVIRPILMNGKDVSLQMISQIPHVLMTINAEDELPIFSNFDTHEIVREFDMTGLNIRKRRRVRKYVTMSVINKANTVVYLYYMNPSTHRRQYFIRLRLNEKNLIQSYTGTTWLAYDRRQQPLLINNKWNLLILNQHAGDNKFDAVITSKKKYASIDYSKPQKPRYLEVFAAADQSFLRKHGTKKMALKFINAVISGVNMVFRHNSLNTSFHVILKDVKFLDKNEKVTITRKDPKQSLRNACRYMFDYRSRKRSLKFEFGIFFTREKFGYSGFTPLYRMCVDYKSCTLIHGTGLQTAFIVAHEIGHSVGLSHDGDMNECANDTVKGSIMAPYIQSRFNKYHWSKCSRKQIKDNLQYFTCLNDIPSNYKIPPATELPGDLYTINDQCRYTFGKGYGDCLGRRNSDQYCSYLFCKYPSSKNRCLYYPLARADGTKCDKDFWCIDGKCLPHGRLTPEPIDGNWSEWSNWGSCSQSCGPGIRIRRRDCDNPKPLFGGRDCNGLKINWELCKYNDCTFNPIFEDKRSNACYFLYEEGWSWMSDQYIKEKVKSLKLGNDFESGFGSWRHSNITKTEWILNNGSTPTHGTGPDVDHTLGNESGSYMFFESSHPLLNGDQSRLLSQPILVPRVCLKMFFHMNGKSIGTLRILKMNLNETVIKELWTRKSVAGKYWYSIEVNVTHNTEYMIGIEATRKNSYMSDIAIDDIEIHEGTCKRDRYSSTQNNDENSCRLYCQNPKHKYLQIEKPVPDGLGCNDRTNNVCVLGKCERVGCDNKVGSDLQYDICGVCGGKNQTCSYQEIHLKVKLLKLSQPVFTIPQGCTDFKLTKLSSSVVKLAIKDKENNLLYYYDDVQGGPYKWNYLNIASSTIRYQVFQNQTEKIFIEKVQQKTKAEIQLIVPGSTMNISDFIHLKYSFYISNKTEHDVYSWMFHQFSPCTVACGGGNKTALYKCFNIKTKKTVDPLKCSTNAVEIVNTTTSCNERKCKTSYKFLSRRWSKCSVCGRVGFMTRNISCVMQTNGQKLSITDETKCEGKTKPRNKSKCYIPCRDIVKRCVERSRLCPGYVKKGYCSYRTVQTLCCKSCKTVNKKNQPPV